MHKKLISATAKPFEPLRNQSGMTLLEVIVVMLVIVVLVVSIYIGIVYAEKTLLTNYRDRVATLLLAGELEMEYYRHTKYKPFELQVHKQYVLDDLNPDHILWAYMTIQLKNLQESSNSQLLYYKSLEATLRWFDPASNKERYITMREDYFI
jgi:prepilin-type N-terminal cleavage/methylation domain-containing protein